MYSRTFTWLVEKINRSLASKVRAAPKASRRAVWVAWGWELANTDHALGQMTGPRMLRAPAGGAPQSLGSSTFMALKCFSTTGQLPPFPHCLSPLSWSLSSNPCLPYSAADAPGHLGSCSVSSLSCSGFCPISSLLLVLCHPPTHTTTVGSSVSLPALSSSASITATRSCSSSSLSSPSSRNRKNMRQRASR